MGFERTADLGRVVGGVNVEDWSLDDHVREWRDQIAGRAAMAADVDELESHLRDRVDDLMRAGLAPDEAFLIAVKRMGAVDELSHEFAREHADRLWKQLLPAAADSARPRVPLAGAIGLAVLAGALAKAVGLLPGAAEYSVFGSGLDSVVYGTILVLAVLAALFAVRSRPPAATMVAIAVVFAASAALFALYPFSTDGMTWVLAAIHLPVLLWLCTGVLYASGDWRSGRGRMEFIRFTGEWVAYYALIALGGGVLIALTIGLFSAVGMDASWFVQEWMLPCGAAGAVIIAAWLVDAKQSVIENIAPVLTKVFTPLFTALLLALIVIGFSQGSLVEADRDVLILFDATLIVVLALLLYSMSARDPLAAPGWFDRLQIVLLGSALVVDLVVLVAMLTRIGAFGLSANKAASLGLNLILLANLAWAMWLQIRFALGRSPFATVERWQTAYVPVYAGWAAIVVVAFPPLFAFD